MLSCFTQDRSSFSPIILLLQQDFDSWLSGQSAVVKNWLLDYSQDISNQKYVAVPNSSGKLDFVLLVLNHEDNFAAISQLAASLTRGVYQFKMASPSFPANFAYLAALAWGLGSYRFEKYVASQETAAKLLIDASLDCDLLCAQVESSFMARDLINIPTEDLGPPQFGQFATEFAKKHKAKINITVGEKLLKAGFPLTYAVGKGSSRDPRMIDLRWGDKHHKKITLVGKGVCFDTGGLNLKSGTGMRLMKKDKSGAAFALALAQMIISQNLPVNLRVLIPAVENSVSGNSYRPGDVLRARNGKTIEVSNTDAEGRLVLADALIEACEQSPEILIDFASLTGAARVAVGPDLPVLFSNNDSMAKQLLQCGIDQKDWLWQLPLHSPYLSYLQSSVADLMNSAEVPMAGSITAALFLQQFVDENVSWAHLDIYGWNAKSLPGRPVGGDVLGLRAVYQYLQNQL